MIALVRICNKDWLKNPPMGLLYVGGALKKAGFDVKIYHITEEEINHYAQLIAKKDPLFVGLSVFTGGEIEYAVEFSRELRRYYNGIILWGGIHPTLLPNQTLGEDYVDMIITGEGEVTTVELAKALEQKKSLKGIRGLGYKKSGKLVINSTRPLLTEKELDNYKLDWDLVDLNKYVYSYFDVGKVISWVTSRGCPYRCSFCYNVKFNQQQWRAHSVEKIVREVKELKEQYDFEGIWFKDDNFIIDRKRAINITGQLRMPYFIEASVNLIDDAFAKQLNDTMCREVAIGFESGSPRVLKDIIHKPFTIEQILKGVKLLADYPSIKVAGFLIFGLPGETREDFQQSLNLVVKLLELNKNINISAGRYLPYPGSESYESAIKTGFKPPQTTEGWSLLNRWTDDMELTWVDWLTSKEIVRIRKNIQVLISLARYKTPLLTSLASYRLVSGNYFMPVDLWLLRKIRAKYMYGDDKQWSTRLVRSVINKATGQKRNYYWT